jgi:hypothetical protein
MKIIKLNFPNYKSNILAYQLKNATKSKIFNINLNNSRHPLKTQVYNRQDKPKLIIIF